MRLRNGKIIYRLNVNAKEFVPKVKKFNVNAKEFSPEEVPKEQVPTEVPKEQAYKNTITGQIVYLMATAVNAPKYLQKV
jgi:hypothetical protein